MGTIIKNISPTDVVNAVFWENLGELYNWYEPEECVWIENATKFHYINLNEGWDKAVEYLSTLTQEQ